VKSWKKENVLSAAVQSSQALVSFSVKRMEQFYIFVHPNAREILILAGYRVRSDGQKPDVKPEERKIKKVRSWSAHT